MSYEVRSRSQNSIMSKHATVVSHEEIEPVPQEFQIKPSKLNLWRDLPEWQQEDNALVESGYRTASASLVDCYKSWFFLHNEFVNIWSHVFGAALFGALPIYIFTAEIPPRYAVAAPADIAVCTLYFVGVAICFVLSSTFHTLMSHSAAAFEFGIQLDFQGVLLLMWGATIPMIYYGFLCDPHLRWVYWSLQTAFALACAVFTLQPRFREPGLRPLRAATFGSFAASSILPVVHAIVRYGWETQEKRMGLLWVFVTLTFNGLGATAYAIKFPERWFRRRFDIFGASHQILHIMVILAGLSHTMGVLQSFDYLHDHGDTCPKPSNS